MSHLQFWVTHCTVRFFQTHQQLNPFSKRSKWSSQQIGVLRFWLLVESTACNLSPPRLQQLLEMLSVLACPVSPSHVKVLGNGVNFPSDLQLYDGLICRCFTLWLPLSKFWVVIGGACCSQMATGFSYWSFVVICVDCFETPGHPCDTWQV